MYGSRLVRLVVGLVLVLRVMASPSFAQPASAVPSPQSGKPSKPSLDSLGFGVGVGFRHNFLSPDLVGEAQVDANGIVRVDKRTNTHTGFVFETHYLPIHNSRVGFGPFVAAEAGSDSVIASVGVGLLLAWRVNETRGFGLGVGYAAQPSVRVLGSEFVENQPAPTGLDGKPLPIRLQERDKGALIAILSVVF